MEKMLSPQPSAYQQKQLSLQSQIAPRTYTNISQLSSKANSGKEHKKMKIFNKESLVQFNNITDQGCQSALAHQNPDYQSALAHQNQDLVC